jgi:predicted metal-dependent hydrolase
MIQDVQYEVRVYRKRTRNFSYRITAQKISITLPDFYKSAEVIEKYKQEWLGHAIERVVSDKTLSKFIPFKKWENISIFGMEYKVLFDETIHRNRYNADTKTFEVRHDIDHDKIKDIFARFIKNNFEQLVQKRVFSANLATINKPLSSVQIKRHSSRWGSCSSKGELTISVNTLLAPLWVIDYVIIHELCHLIHMDHSIQFWSEVRKYYPRYREAVMYLKEHGMHLSL